MNKNAVALVIGSGGIKPLEVIKLFELMIEHRLQADTIIGCSGGALGASAWASGYDLLKCQALIDDYFMFTQKEKPYQQIDYRTILNLLHLPGGRFNQSAGIMRKDKLLNFFRKIFKGLLIEELPIGLILAATDLETGKQVLIDKGPVAEAIYASTAVYPLLPPIKHQGKWLVDGAYSSGIPTLAAVNLGYEKIISLAFVEKRSFSYQSYAEFITEYTARILQTHAFSQNAVATYIHDHEILFIKFYFDQIISVTDAGIDTMAIVHKVFEETIDKHKQDILDFWSTS